MPMKAAERDGVKLSFLDTGAGDPALVFVHGWSCNRSFWAPQVRAFSRSHRVIAIDLRGHGRSDKPRQAYTMKGFADDVAWLCEELDVRGPVIVGHSMGGVIALLLAARRPALAAAAVFVDAPLLPMAGGPGSGFAQFLEALSRPDYMSTASTFIEGMFRPYSDPTLRSWTLQAMTSTPQHVMASALEELIAAGPHLPSGDLPLPVLSVTAAGGQNLAELKERYTNLGQAQVTGAGHFLQLEVPEQFNAMLRRFMDVAL